MSLFPFMKSVDEQELALTKTYREYELNFETGKLTGKILEGKEALKVWIVKTLLTTRYTYPIYTWDFGQDLEELIGQGYERGFIQSEVERRIKECLLINEHIANCTNFSIELIQDCLKVSFTVHTTYGEVDIYI